MNLIVDAVGVCWNCNVKGHTARKYKKPKYPATYNKNCKAFMENKNTSSGGDQVGKPKKDSPEFQRKQWEANVCSMLNGVLYINCKTCGLNTNNGDHQHGDYMKNPSLFTLAPTHFYVKDCACLGQGYSGVMKTVSGAQPPPPQLSSSSAPPFFFAKASSTSSLSDL